MDGHQNATAVCGGQAPMVSGGQALTVSGCQPSSGFPAEMVPSMGSSSMTLEFIPGDNMGGSDDANHEWLSLLVEDCLSSTSCYPAFPLPPTTTITVAPSLPIGPPIQECVAQSISRAKRSKLTPTIVHVTPYDPPLLHQPHWLAESELIYPRKEEHEENNQLLLPPQVVPVGEEEQQQPRRCSHCQSQRTPQWRAGPLGPKTLCNACGVRFKSGRLLPEYRPAKSPTFVSYKHSNSHKKVMEMRMGLFSSDSK